MINCALAELDLETITKLMNLSSPWFNTYGFCALDSTPPAERVLFSQDDQGQIAHAQYYRESNWYGILKKIEVIGPIYPALTDLRQLMDLRGAQLASISFLYEEDANILLQTAGGTIVTERTHEDFIIELPATVEEYFNSLGPWTRRNFRKYMREFDRDLKGRVSHITMIKDQISLQSVSSLVALNRLRIEGKGGHSLWDQELIEKRLKLANHCGFFCGFEMDGRLIGGTLSFIHGEDGYGVLLGHDPVFNYLNLGTLCIFETVNQLIGMGKKRAHFQWGKSWYKTQFGGYEYPLYTVTVFHKPLIKQLWVIRRFVESSLLHLRRLNGKLRRLAKFILVTPVDKWSKPQSSQQSKNSEK